MATNLLIALAASLGSATLIITVVYLFLKVFAPRAFEEKISGQMLEYRRTSVTKLHAPLINVVDDSIQSLSGNQTLEALKAIPIQRLNTIPVQRLTFHNLGQSASSVSGIQIAAVLSGEKPLHLAETDKKPGKVDQEEAKEKEVLSPTGQSSSSFGMSATKASAGVQHETLCGIAR